MESSVIYSLAGKSWGHWPIVSHGISMGGHMAALSALNWDEENAPIGLVPCMAACSASWTFTSGVLSDSLPWDLLEEQYYNEVRYHNDIRKLIYPNEEALKKVISQYPPYIPESKWSQILRLSHPKSQKKSDSVVEFMRGVLDECTHFRNYCSPMDPSLIILVASDIDAYQPKDGAQVFQDIWPGLKSDTLKNMAMCNPTSSDKRTSEELFMMPPFETYALFALENGISLAPERVSKEAKTSLPNFGHGSLPSSKEWWSKVVVSTLQSSLSEGITSLDPRLAQKQHSKTH
ncbi:Uncharacterized protein C4orf29 -like protein [Caligus rogercresseyi]|uniref:Uncharacterized protein C4orf29 -like protein n=1 Tax=Caligus rogercresseyi TaxID=217165 RepID=A0A7T8KHS1_CALRO|nr:Uncharacterized protein C4orf29 -like protein [Caligus rogercresseyi]